MSATFQHHHRNSEWELDGALICADVRVEFEFEFDSEGPHYSRFVDARDVATGERVASWLWSAMSEWCVHNSDKLDAVLMRSVTRAECFAVDCSDAA